MNKMKRHICALLSAIMLLSVMAPMAAFAAEAEQAPAAEVEPQVRAEVRPVNVVFLDAEGKQVASYRVMVAGDVTSVAISDVQVPEGFKATETEASH